MNSTIYFNLTLTASSSQQAQRPRTHYRQLRLNLRAVVVMRAVMGPDRQAGDLEQPTDPINFDIGINLELWFSPRR